MIEVKNKNIHWGYYLPLEADLDSLSRYIEFDEPNFDVYSVELARFILSASAEVEAVLKDLIFLYSRASPRNISECMNSILKSSPDFPDKAVLSQRYGLMLRPWDNWRYGKAPDWWQAYNGIKHDRRSSFHMANLRNALNAVAALYLVNVSYSFQLLNSNSDGYPFDLRNVIPSLKTSVDLFRIDDPLAYLHDAR